MAQQRHEKLGLSDDQALHMYETMLLARKVDERMWLLNRAGKIPFVISCQGQEGAQVGAATALQSGKDYVAPYYRDFGVVLSLGVTARDLFLSGFAKAEDTSSGGRQMPGHFSSTDYHILTQSSPVSTQIPHAVGTALASQMDGIDAVSMTSFGEGSSNQGEFHEAANFAGVHQLPVIFLCENNKYAISVPQEKQLACENVADRASSYGMPGYTVDGNDPLAVYGAVKNAVDRARNGEGPSLVETISYRFTPHSSDDDDMTYREKSEVEEAKKKDSLHQYADYLRQADILTETVEKDVNERVETLVDEGTEYAENAPYADAESALNYVYEED